MVCVCVCPDQDSAAANRWLMDLVKATMIINLSCYDNSIQKTSFVSISARILSNTEPEPTTLRLGDSWSASWAGQPQWSTRVLLLMVRSVMIWTVTQFLGLPLYTTRIDFTIKQSRGHRNITITRNCSHCQGLNRNYKSNLQAVLCPKLHM